MFVTYAYISYISLPIPRALLTESPRTPSVVGVLVAMTQTMVAMTQTMTQTNNCMTQTHSLAFSTRACEAAGASTAAQVCDAWA